MRQVKRQIYLDSNKSPISKQFFDNEKNDNTTLSVNIPMVPKQRPPRIKESIQDNNNNSVVLVEENLTTEFQRDEYNLISSYLTDTKELGDNNSIKDDTQSLDLANKESTNKYDLVVSKTDSEVTGDMKKWYRW